MKLIMVDLTKIIVLVETTTNYQKTAMLANNSFESRAKHFSEHNLKWMYEVAFGGQTSVVAATYEGQKIGQAVILWHDLKLNGKKRGCAQLVDLFVVPEYRSFSVVRKIYRKLNELLGEQSDRFVLTTPNPKSARLNARFLKLRPGGMLDIRLGLTIPSPTNRTTQSLWVESEHKSRVIKFMQGYMSTKNSVEVCWTPKSLADRLSNANSQYAIHKNGPLLAITTSRVFKGMPLILICGTFVIDTESLSKSHLRKILSAAAVLHRRPLFLYVGINHLIPAMPGISLPNILRPSQMSLQIREGTTAQDQISFDRFEAIDFDFA